MKFQLLMKKILKNNIFFWGGGEGGGVQWLSGRVLDLRLRGCRFEPHWHQGIVSLNKTYYPCLVQVQPRETCPDITEKLFTGT